MQRKMSVPPVKGSDPGERFGSALKATMGVLEKKAIEIRKDAQEPNQPSTPQLTATHSRDETYSRKMSDHLRLPILKSNAVHYHCGCSVAVPFADAVKLSGLVLPKTKDDSQPEWAQGGAAYKIGTSWYSCRVSLHVEKKDESSCLSVDFYWESATDKPDLSPWVVKLPSIEQGLENLYPDMGKRKSSAKAVWSDVAPSIGCVPIPGDWPPGVKIGGIQLKEPSGRASAIIQNSPDEGVGSIVSVNTSGGTGIAPEKMKASFRAMARLLVAFRTSDWILVGKAMDEYEQC